MGQFGLEGDFWVGWNSLSEVCIFDKQMRWFGMEGAFFAQKIFSKNFFHFVGNGLVLEQHF